MPAEIEIKPKTTINGDWMSYAIPKGHVFLRFERNIKDQSLRFICKKMKAVNAKKKEKRS